MKIYGLTGAPGCGKSAVLKIFAGFGRHVLDADAVCAAVHDTPGGAFHEKLKDLWGPEVLTPEGKTDRSALAAKVFASEEELLRLENLLYPEIQALARKFFSALPESPAAVFEVPLLFERKWNTGMDGTIAVWSPPAVQYERLTVRGWSPEEIARRCSKQFSAAKKLELADYGLINDGTLEKLKKQCEELNHIL